MVESEVHNLNEGTTVFNIFIWGGLSSDIHGLYVRKFSLTATR